MSTLREHIDRAERSVEPDPLVGPGDVVTIRGDARLIVAIALAPDGLYVVTRKPKEALK